MMHSMEEDAGPFVSKKWDFSTLGSGASSHSRDPGSLSLQVSHL